MNLAEKVKITNKVLSEIPESSNLVINLHIDQVISKWWKTGRQTGLRLTEIGDTAFQLANVDHSEVQFAERYDVFLLELSKKMPCPYYVYARSIRIYDSKTSMLVKLYGGIRPYLNAIKTR